MALIISEVKTKTDFNQFILLPYKIHKNHAQWVPNLINDDRTVFSPKRNRAFTYCDTIQLLARLDNKVVGRVMGIIHHHYNNTNNEQNARFAFIETYNNYQVFEALVNAVIDWAKQKGCKKVIGPLGFSDKDPQGFLTQGFDQQTMFMTNCSFEYMKQFVEQMGFTPHTKLVEYKLNISAQLQNRFEPFVIRAQNNTTFRLKHFNNIFQIKPYIRPIFGLMNRTYTDIYGYSSLTDKEADDFANRFLPFISPKLFKVVTDNNNNVIGFLIAITDFSHGLKKSGGRLFPTGWFHILKSMKTSKTVMLVLGSVDNNYRNKGIDALMGGSLINNALKMGLKHLDSHLIMETNLRMRAEIERLDGSVLYKRYCIYQKNI